MAGKTESRSANFYKAEPIVSEIIVFTFSVADFYTAPIQTVKENVIVVSEFYPEGKNFRCPVAVKQIEVLNFRILVFSNRGYRKDVCFFDLKITLNLFFD
jgi:hypothetical protein